MHPYFGNDIFQALELFEHLVYLRCLGAVIVFQGKMCRWSLTAIRHAFLKPDNTYKYI